ncbi:gamma-tubulin complex component 3-like [Drosophila subpulchrella]|uniref:gamma-tubulin complex component 3-like n=1 Tax=Drosophila subpulchrella TaxID=1486046 RepID=UPI0018A1AADE|nr:gamma-tubulin complex component 3-like [Drosophila subpulchrella]
MSQDNLGADVAGMSSKLADILSALCICIEGKQPPQVQEETLSRVTKCVTSGTFGHPISLTEHECVQKTMKILSARCQVDGEDTAKHFFGLYKKVLQLKLDPYARHSLMSNLLAMADKQTANGEVYLSARSDNLSLALGSLASSSTTLNSGAGKHTTGIGSHNGNGLSQEGAVGYSYDPTQSGFGLGQHTLPNYMKDLVELEVSDEIVVSAIYSFIGVQGKFLKKDVVTGYFKLDPLNMEALTMGQAGMLLRLSIMGYYHDRVAMFADVNTGYNPLGCMGQALISKLKEELGEYHGQVSVLHDEVIRYRKAQVNGKADCGGEPGDAEELTLFKLLAWHAKPLRRLMWLANVANKCKMQKGGQLASTVYRLMDNGASMVNKLVDDILTAVCGPMVRMISKWMLEGGINDTHNEFFVESLQDVGSDRLWHDKFRLRLPMLPSFVSMDLANKILKTGKCINFLREICEVEGLIKGRDELKAVMDNNVAHFFSYVADTKWHAAVETCYQQTSKLVLDIMVGHHKLLDHLQAMRRYMLLGQGDFVGILIDNMKDDLERNGADIYANDLSSMLDAALRCTNAQYEDPDILNHLDIIVQRPFAGDIGWDIISLKYVVHGPLATMLEPTMPTYKLLFKPLWRMKHMEFVLSIKIWKEQMGNAKSLRPMIAEIGKASHRLNLFTSEIMHFIHQMQYYVLFEVIECNWVELQKKIQQATTLDDILEAHENFLEIIKMGCFVGDETDVEHSLETVYENIICLESWQSNFYKVCFQELNARKELAKEVEKSEKQGVYGLTNEMMLQRDQESKIFAQKVEAACHGLEVIASAYEKAVSSFLMTLNSNRNPNLVLFGTRLDFNEYYKNRDTNLSKPLTFEHIRMSNMFSLNHRSSTSSRFVVHAPTTKE